MNVWSRELIAFVPGCFIDLPLIKGYVTMKLKAKKTSQLFVAENVTEALHKKSKKSRTLLFGCTKDAATAPITSSVQKKRKESNLASPTQICVRNKGPGMGSQCDRYAEEACHDLRLAISNMDGSLTDQKENSGLTSPASILETIFSPVFHLFKGLNGEVSTQFSSNGEKFECADQKAYVPLAKGGSNASSPQGISKKLVGPCSSNAGIIEELVDGKNGCSCLEDNITSLNAEHLISIASSSDEEIYSSQVAFDVVEDGIGWSLVHEQYSQHIERMEEDLLDSDGASLYLAVQQTKSLECSSGREKGNASPDEDEFDDFDPYLFIKNLPDLSELVSPCRPILLPRKTRRCPAITLVLDLDETLVHSTLEPCHDAEFTFPVSFNHQEYLVYVRSRPHLQMFLERVAQMFEIIVFTASQCVYAEQLLNLLDPNRRLIRYRVYRESCVFVEGNYLKDLTVLGRDLAKVAIVDNSPQAFGFQVDNGIPIESWFDNWSDSALIDLLPFLETLVGVDDVRPIIAKKFNIRKRIDAATDLPTNQRDSFQRCL